MRHRSACALAIGVLSAATLFGSEAAIAESPAPQTGARAVIRDASGAVLGTLVLQRTRRGTVVATASAGRLPPGFHGFHVHAVGICDPQTTDAAGSPAPFLSAGLHFDPAAGGHGNHAGDLPALLATQPGRAQSTVETDRFTIASLFDTDGSAIILHAAADNLGNIPSRYVSSTTGLAGPDAATLATGDAGGRLGCGVITPLR